MIIRFTPYILLLLSYYNIYMNDYFILTCTNCMLMFHIFTHYRVREPWLYYVACCTVALIYISHLETIALEMFGSIIN